MFTKSDLKDFMRVQYRGGDERIYIREALFTGAQCTNDDVDYNQSLYAPCGWDALDIMKVWEAPSDVKEILNVRCKGPLRFDREKEEASGKKHREIEEAENRIKEAKALLEEATAHLNKLKKN